MKTCEGGNRYRLFPPYRLKRKSRQSNIIGDKETTRILKSIQDTPLDKQEDLFERMLLRYKSNKKITQALEEIKSKRLYWIKPNDIAEEVDVSQIDNLDIINLLG